MAEIQSAIIEVTVFTDRVLVLRRGSLSLDTGVHRIEFANLPLTLVAESVRATGRGTAAAILLGVDTQRAYFSDTPASNARELEQQIQKLEELESQLADQVSTAEVNAGFVRKLADQSAEQLARGMALGRAHIGQGDELVGFVSRQLEQAQATLRQLSAARRDNQKELARLRMELERLHSARPRERYVASVEVEVRNGGELTLELTYMLTGASWLPLYDLRASAIESDQPVLGLSYLAQITQNTGEDWDDTRLILSTARPALAAVRPELRPWFIDTQGVRFTHSPRMFAEASAMALSASAATVGDISPSAVTAPVANMEAIAAAIASSGSSITFQLSQRASVPSDGSPHKVNIGTFELNPVMDHIALPGLAGVAFRRATVANSHDIMLLPGQANLFLDGDYLGVAPLRLVAPNEEFELTFGVDDRVFVKRRLTSRAVDKAFVIGDKRRIRVGYEVELRNLTTAKVAVDVRDQYPISRNEQIKTKLEAVDPRPASQSELGELKWLLTLAPAEKRIIRFEFAIEHPADMAVTGLP